MHMCSMRLVAKSDTSGFAPELSCRQSSSFDAPSANGSDSLEKRAAGHALVGKQFTLQPAGSSFCSHIALLSK